MSIRLAICDDYKHFINTMRLEIMDNEDIELVGECNLAVDCISMLSQSKPDVLLLDIQMETSSAGIDVLPKIKALFPEDILLQKNYLDLPLQSHTVSPLTAFLIGWSGYVDTQLIPFTDTQGD
jgi:DNA-binding NarL/FixJ family response regulator